MSARHVAAVVLAGLALALGGCRIIAPQVPVLEQGEVVVLLSADRQAYQQPVEAFTDAIDVPVQVVDLQGKARSSTGEALIEAVATAKPPLVFALGADAAHLARQALPNVPIVFAVVINWKQSRLKDSPNVTGVALEVPAEVQFTQLKLVAPHIDRVAVIHSAASDLVVAQAASIAKNVNVELVPVRVESRDEVESAWKSVRRKVDALWMVPDGKVLDRDTFNYLKDATLDAGVCFMGFSDSFVEAGCLLSLSADYDGLGAQAGLLARRILDGEVVPADHPVEQPVSTFLTLNVAAAEEIGLELDEDILDIADHLVGEDEDADE